MSNKVEFVDYQEFLSVKIGKFLLSKGFTFASCIGRAVLDFNELYQKGKDGGIGVLLKDSEAKPLKRWFGGLTTREVLGFSPRESSRGVFFGTVWFNNSHRGTNTQNWVFEMYGRKHVESVRQLAEEMATTFNVKISICLVDDQQNAETFLSDCHA